MLLKERNKKNKKAKEGEQLHLLESEESSTHREGERVNGNTGVITVSSEAHK